MDRTRLRLLSKAVVTARAVFGDRTVEVASDPPAEEPQTHTIVLPPPCTQGEVSVEEALSARRSVREFSAEALTDRELSQLLWAAQGVTDIEGRRTSPSAGAVYPLGLYVATARGFFRYEPKNHELHMRLPNDLRRTLYWAAQCRSSIRLAPATFVFAALRETMEHKYGPERTDLYIHLEAGHAAQNLLLQAVTLGLSAVPIGGFFEDQVVQVLAIQPERPLYVIAAGHTVARESQFSLHVPVES